MNIHVEYRYWYAYEARLKKKERGGKSANRKLQLSNWETPRNLSDYGNHTHQQMDHWNIFKNTAAVSQTTGHT